MHWEVRFLEVQEGQVKISGVERGALGWKLFGRRNEEMKGDFGRVVRA